MAATSLAWLNASVQRRRIAVVGRNHFLRGRPWSLDLLDVAGLPTLSEGGCLWAVESDNGEVALARNGLHPVLFLSRRRGGAEVEINGAIRVDLRVVPRTQQGKRLAIGKTGGLLGVVQRQRPEPFRRNVLGEIQSVVGRAEERIAIGVLDYRAGTGATTPLASVGCLDQLHNLLAMQRGLKSLCPHWGFDLPGDDRRAGRQSFNDFS